MSNLEIIAFYAGGKKSYQTELKKEFKKIKNSLNILNKKQFIKKLKDTEYSNF